MEFRYTRLRSDPDGGSLLEDASLGFESVDFAPPAPPLQVAAFGRAVGLSLVGGGSDWGGDVPHPTPFRQVMCPLVGRFQVTTSDGTMQVFGPGDLLLLEDTWGQGHSTRFLDDEVVVAATRLEDDVEA